MSARLDPAAPRAGHVRASRSGAARGPRWLDRTARDTLPKMRPALRARTTPENDVVAPAKRDAGVERAIERMRERPTEGWTVASLAKVAFASRAAFARKFVAATGTTPLAWLTALRISLATRRLVATDARLADVAEEIGYANEFAFGRAFKRAMGISPGAFRKRVRGASGRGRVVCRAA